LLVLGVELRGSATSITSSINSKLSKKKNRKIILFAIVPKNKKEYIETNLTKEMKVLSSENYKILKKEIK
jgi:hypothetical protein